METVSGPDGELEASLDPVNPERAFSVTREGRTVIEPSPVGLNAHGPLLTEGFRITDTERRSVEESYETPHGKRRRHDHRAREATFTLETPDERVVEFDLRVSDSGVAYRYRVPLHDTTMVFGESSGFRFPPATTAWLHGLTNNHEATGRATPMLEANGEYDLPGLFDTGEDWVLLAEAGVDGSYAAGHLSGDGAGGVRIAHPDTSVWGRDELETPWRVAVVGDLGTVVESDLIPSLNEAPESDFEWVEPGRVAWSWWSESDSPSDFERQQDYVDYAAERGWEYVLVDEGWSTDWVPNLVAYADERDIGVLVWSHFTELLDADERRERLARWSEWGVAGIKVDFMDHDDHGRMAFYESLAEDAAAEKLLVNFHGSVVPTGLERRYPHVMTYEGVKGAEHLKWATLAPTHNAVLPFTRNAVGPMDFTPVTFSAEKRHTTEAHELALSVVYESGLQHFADSVDAYAERPVAESVLEDVPAAPEETRFLRGEPGSEATIARKAGGEWFVGSIVAGAARVIELDVSGFDAEEAHLVRDGESGLVAETVDANGAVEISVERNGGFVLRL